MMNNERLQKTDFKHEKIPERMCVACREKNNKNAFVRIVSNKSGEVSVDGSGKSHGRGAYIHATPQCLKAAVKKRSLERALRRKIPDEIYETLENLVSKDSQ